MVAGRWGRGWVIAGQGYAAERASAATSRLRSYQDDARCGGPLPAVDVGGHPQGVPMTHEYVQVDVHTARLLSFCPRAYVPKTRR